MYSGFRCCPLDAQHHLWQGKLPDNHLSTVQQFDDLWTLHPEAYNEIKIQGRTVKTPRWEQAYNKPYGYSGVTNLALPVPPQIYPIWGWVQETIDARLNGILLTWYDGQLGHYIGKHRDSTQNMIEGAPIVTLSLGRPGCFDYGPGRVKAIRIFQQIMALFLSCPIRQTWPGRTRFRCLRSAWVGGLRSHSEPFTKTLAFALPCAELI